MNNVQRSRIKCWEIIADNLHKAGWSLGSVATVDREGRTIWIADAHGYGKRFIFCADEILTAFVELQRAIHEFAGECDLVMAARKWAMAEKVAASLALGSGDLANSIDTPCLVLPELLSR